MPRSTKPFFRGETLNRDTPIFLAEGAPITAGLTLPDSVEHLVAADQGAAVARGKDRPSRP